MADFTTTLQGRAMELVAQHGGVRPASRVLMCDAGYLSRLMRGEKTEPGAALLKRMGLRREVSYAVAAPHQPVSAEAGKPECTEMDEDVKRLYAQLFGRTAPDYIIEFARAVVALVEATHKSEKPTEAGLSRSTAEPLHQVLVGPANSIESKEASKVSDAQILTLARQWRDWTSANIKPLKFSEPNVLSFARAVLALAGSAKQSAALERMARLDDEMGDTP